MARPIRTENCGYWGKHENQDTTPLNNFNKEYGEFSRAVKEYALSRRNASPYNVHTLKSMIDGIQEYAERTIAENKPLTVAGFILASGVNSRTFYDMKEGMYDSVVDEYKVINDIPFESEETVDKDTGEVIPLVYYSRLIEKCYLLIQEQRETACSSLKGNPAGNIFLLKAQQGFREEDTPQTLNQTLVIADGKQAHEALELLK